MTNKHIKDCINQSENIYIQIAKMRLIMKLVGYTKEEITNATQEVTNAKSFEEAKNIIKKFVC